MSRSNVPIVRKRLLRAIILALVVLLTSLVAVVLILRRPPAPNCNALALRDRASQDKVGVILRAPIDLNYKTKAEILALRRQAANHYTDFLLSAYEPSEAVFGQVVDRLPWWGMKGQFYYGSGPRSIKGPAEEARFLINPYLLVAADFFGLTTQTTPGWNTATISEADLDRADFPLVCMPRALDWFPRQARAVAVYNVSECMARMSQWATQPVSLPFMTFDLIAYNARDLNLNYIYVSFKESRNLEQLDRSEKVFWISHFLHQGGSCGYPGGCNNMSPATPEISNYWLTGLPAQANIKLWKDEPSAPDQTPDMLFVIYFE